MWPAFVLFAALPTGMAAAAPDRPITALIPADCLVAYSSKPYAEAAPTSMPASNPVTGDAPPRREGSQLSHILAILNLSGMIPDEGQVFADIAARLPLFGRYEHAAILMDVSSKVIRRPATANEPASESLRLNSLQCAAIFRTGPDRTDILEHLNQLIGRYTNKSVGTLTRETAHGLPYQRLADNRLIDWAIWEWGPIGDDYVICFGAGSFEKIAAVYAGKSPTLADDKWFKAAGKKVHAEAAHAQWFIALAKLEACLTDVAGSRYEKVIEALKADHMTHDLWAIGRRGRAMTWYRCFRRNGEDVLHVYSDPDNPSRAMRRIIPDAAKHYAIIQVPTRWLVDNLPRAWVAAQSDDHIRLLTAEWKRVEQVTGVNIGENLFEHLGENIVIFDYPPHPLDIPFALTIAIEINDRKAVSEALDALLLRWGQYLDQRADRRGTRLVRLYVKHDPDGVWFLQAGILGPALKVTDKFVVISWSPQALREALKYIEPDAKK